jgi:uncharacterized protein
MSRQVQLLQRLTEACSSVILIGSSMGGYASTLFAAQSQKVDALVLMCPAFAFYRRWSEKLGRDAVEKWARNGEMPTQHFATGKMESIGWSLMADAQTLPEEPDLNQPTLILHGKQDEIVPFDGSVNYAATRPNIRLEAFDSDHSLGDVVDELIEASFEFLAPWLRVGGDRCDA